MPGCLCLAGFQSSVNSYCFFSTADKGLLLFLDTLGDTEDALNSVINALTKLTLTLIYQ